MCIVVICSLLVSFISLSWYSNTELKGICQLPIVCLTFGIALWRWKLECSLHIPKHFRSYPNIIVQILTQKHPKTPYHKIAQNVRSFSKHTPQTHNGDPNCWICCGAMSFFAFEISQPKNQRARHVVCNEWMELLVVGMGTTLRRGSGFLGSDICLWII